MNQKGLLIGSGALKGSADWVFIRGTSSPEPWIQDSTGLHKGVSHQSAILLRILQSRVYESEVPERSSIPVDSRADPDPSRADVHQTTQTSVCSACCWTGHTGDPPRPAPPPHSRPLMADSHRLAVKEPWFLIKRLFYLLFSPRLQRGTPTVAWKV